MQISLWQDTCKPNNFPEIQNDVETDVLIIGGGMAGILCAYFLEQNNVDYILCEAKNIGCGTTSRTTAVLSAQHDILYSQLIKKHGEQYAKLYLQANLNAITDFRKISDNISCDFEICPSYQYSAKEERQLKNEIAALKKLNFNAKLTKSIPLPVKAKTNLCFPIGAQFHPLKFIYGIS